jgi:N-methylhydantoinase A
MATAFHDRAKLRPGHYFTGPAILVEYGATSFLPPGWRAVVDAWENIQFTPQNNLRRKAN